MASPAKSAVRKIRIFVSSPSDVQRERDAVERSVMWLRGLQFIRDQFDLDVYKFEENVPPVVGDVPQQVVNKYLGKPEEADIFICVLWERMGTEFTDPETGKVYQSGTLYEFERAYNENQKSGFPVILLYRKKISVNTQDLGQLDRVNSFFTTFHDGIRKGYYKTFNDVDEFEDLITHNLLNILFERFDLFVEVSSRSAAELSELILRRFAGANRSLHNYPSHIGKEYSIERSEPKQILQWIDDPTVKEQIAFLVDKPGTGKTVAISQLLMLLENRGTTVFSIKADYLSGVRNAAELQQWFQLPIPLEDSIKIIAAQKPVVVLIDQLDALSISLSQDFSTLDLIHRIVLILSQVTNIRIVMSCREFDLNFDPKLSILKKKEYKTFSLAQLDRQQILAALSSNGISSLTRISERMFRLLATPLHLAIYVDLALSESENFSGEQFYSLHQLYDALWKQRISASNVAFVSETIYFIADQMQLQRRLAIPVALLDGQQYQQSRRYLQTIDFIREKHGTFIFFHQTFFDYSYARKFVAENGRIADFVLSSVQGLMERALMLQVLAYLRNALPDLYIQELNKLLFSENLHIHLYLLLIQWFASLDNVSGDERNAAIRLSSNPKSTIRFLLAASGNVHWFDGLGTNYLSSLLSNEDINWRVADFLTSVINGRSRQVIQLFTPYLGKSIEWDRQILFALSRLKNWSEEAGIDLLCEVMKRERDTYRLGDCFSKLLQSNSAQCSRVMRIYLDFVAYDVQQLEQELAQEVSVSDNKITKVWEFEHKLRMKFETVLSEYHIQAIINTLATTVPDAFVENILDWLIAVVMRYRNNDNGKKYPSDAIFGFDIYSYHTPQHIGGRDETTFIRAMANALQLIAEFKPNIFRTLSNKLQGIESDTIQFLLAQGYLANPKEYAVDIFNYLLADDRRLDLGQNHYDSCLLYADAFRFTDQNKRSILETKMLNFYPEWEQDLQYKAWGYTQTLFLKSVPRELLSKDAFRRLQELERKFPELEPRPPVQLEFGAVGSPITGNQLEKASDEDILEIMRVYNEDTHWDAPQRKVRKFGLGGIIELSREISVQAKQFPERYYGLAKKFDESIADDYIVAILDGLSTSEIDPVHIFEIASVFVDRIHGFSRIGFCHALERQADAGVPDNLIEAMTDWALTDKDPPYPNPHLEGADHKRLNEWLQQGINSVRGVALEAVVACAIKRKPKQIDRSFSVLAQAISDPSPAVGACVLQSLMLLLDTDRQQGINLCEQLISTHLPLLEDYFTTYRFLNWASFHYFDRFGKYVDLMLSSDNEYTRQEGARLACQAALHSPTADVLCEQSIHGDAPMRRGAAMTYSRYLGSSDFSEKSQVMILELADDEDDEVCRIVASCLSYLRPEQHIQQLRPFIETLLNRPAIATEPRHLLDFVTPIADEEHELALLVTERMIAIFNAPTKQNFYMDYDETVSLPLAVYNRSFDPLTKEKAMQLFEQLLDMGVQSATAALNNWDEHRAFAIKVIPDEQN